MDTIPDVKKIGFWPTFALVTGNMIGSGVFLLPATLAAYGGVGVWGWIVASIASLALAKIFARLSYYYPHANGGPYAYSRIGLGDFIGFQVAWGYWISVWCTNAAIAVALVGYVGTFIPWVTASSVNSIASGLFFIWLFSWINSKEIKTVGGVQLLTTILKVMPLLFVTVLGIVYVDFSQIFKPVTVDFSFLSNLTAVTTLTFFAYLGMESATVPSEGVLNPEKTIRNATISGTLFTALLYTFSFIVIISILPPEQLANSNAPFAEAAQKMWGGAGKYLVAIGAIISTMGALNGWILVQGQIPMSAARNNLFPALFARTNKHGSPFLGIAVSSVLASILMMVNYSRSLVDAFEFMVKLTTIAVVLPYIFSSITFAKKVREEKSGKRNWGILVSIAAVLFCLWVIIGCGTEVILLGVLLLLLGIPMFWWLRRKKTA